eukprot:14645678-Ditylum_brightwellii.AAC.1
MIDPTTGWFKVAGIKTKRADVIANVIEQMWRDYGVTKCPITAQNLQANRVVERIHQAIGNAIRTF